MDRGWSQLSSIDLLNKLDQTSGVYFISSEPAPTEDTDILVKVGLAVARKYSWGAVSSGLRGRLESYLLCYPRGFYLHALILTPRDKAFKLEQRIHAYLNGKNRKVEFEHSRIEEWFYLSSRDVGALFKYFAGQGVKSHYFAVPYFINMNPTVGKQRKTQPLTTPERRYIEALDPTVVPPSTTQKPLRPPDESASVRRRSLPRTAKRLRWEPSP